MRMGVILAVAVLAGLAVWQSWRAEAAAAEVAQLRADLADRDRVAGIHSDHVLRAEQEAAVRAAFNRELHEQAGANAALNPYLRNAAGKLWP